MENINEHPADKLEEFLDGSLSEAEMNSIQKHVDTCDICQQELEFIKQLKQKVKITDDAQPSELAIKRLHQQIDALPDKQLASTRPISPWWRAAFAAALCLVVIQAGYIGLYSPGDDIDTLRGYPKDNAVVSIRFSPAATERDIRLVLRSVNARIIDGPDSQSRYQIVLNVKRSNRKKVDQLVQDLKEHRNIILEASVD
jgi:anti-sigma factor RsiW